MPASPHRAPRAGQHLYQRQIAADPDRTTLEERFRLYVGSRNIGEIVRSSGTDQTLYFHTDHLGSVDLITNAVGTTVAEQQFDPFGAPADADALALALAPELTRSGFTGHQHDRDLGLIDMKGRICDPLAGRFMSADPISQAPFWSQGLNRYAYVFNDPINNNDPSGFLAPLPGFPAGEVLTGSPLGLVGGVGFNLGTSYLMSGGGASFAGAPGSSRPVDMGTAAPTAAAQGSGGLHATGQTGESGSSGGLGPNSEAPLDSSVDANSIAVMRRCRPSGCDPWELLDYIPIPGAAAGEVGVTESRVLVNLLKALLPKNAAEVASAALAQVPARLTRVFMCRQFVRAAVKILEKIGVKHTILRVQARGGQQYIVSDLFNRGAKPITENGLHYAVEVEGKVLDNLNPGGIARKVGKRRFTRHKESTLLPFLVYLDRRPLSHDYPTANFSTCGAPFPLPRAPVARITGRLLAWVRSG